MPKIDSTIDVPPGATLRTDENGKHWMDVPREVEIDQNKPQMSWTPKPLEYTDGTTGEKWTEDPVTLHDRLLSLINEEVGEPNFNKFRCVVHDAMQILMHWLRPQPWEDVGREKLPEDHDCELPPPDIRCTRCREREAERVAVGAFGAALVGASRGRKRNGG